MKLLITGGCGFIGSHFVDYIINKYPEYEVAVLDKLTYAGDCTNINSDPNKYQFFNNDINDLDLDKIELINVDAIVNFAAETHVDNSIKSSEAFVHTNIKGVHTLLECLRKAPQIKKFIHISTDEVYGSIDEGSFKEEDNLNPGNPYSASKASADLMIKAYQNTYKIPAIIVRPTNNFGPRQYPEKLIPLFVQKLMRGEKVPVYGDGNQVRDWLYVEDTCRALDLILHGSKDGQIWNIAGENELTNIIVVRKILNIMGLGEDRIEYVKDRLGHDRRYSLDCSAIKGCLGWQKEIKFDTQLDTTVKWFMEKYK